MNMPAPNPSDALSAAMRGILEGRDLPPFNSPERHELVAHVRAVIADPVQLQLLGARTLDALLDRLKASAEAERMTALVIDASRRQ